MERWLLQINVLIPYDRRLGLQIRNSVQIKIAIGVELTMSIYKCSTPVNVFLRLIDGSDISIKISLGKESAFEDALCLNASASLRSGLMDRPTGRVLFEVRLCLGKVYHDGCIHMD